MKRVKISKQKYRKICESVLERDKCCVWCGAFMNLTPAHIIRRSQGGPDEEWNIVCGCISCHTAFDKYEIGLPCHVKKRLTDEQYGAYMKTRRIKP